MYKVAYVPGSQPSRVLLRTLYRHRSTLLDYAATSRREMQK
jgi:hypothetical protein